MTWSYWRAIKNISLSLPKISGEYYNAVLAVEFGSTELTTDSIVGNQQPTCLRRKFIKARLKQINPPEEDTYKLSGGSDISRLYFEGNLVAPKTWNFNSSNNINLEINKLKGRFILYSFLDSPEGYQIDIQNNLGQRIAGYLQLDSTL